MTENSAALRSYTYDTAGNITTDTRPGEAFAFTYNNRNRPTSVTRNSVAYASYGYNALEQLVSRSTTAPGGPLGTVHYIHDLQGHIIAEADAATGATTREYVWMAANDNAPTDLPLAVVDDVATTPTLLMVHSDHLGRPIRMTDATKATVWQASYKPWGEVQTISGTVALNLRFPGQYFQIETGLAYNWHRHYDATTGRYTQPDPLGFVDGPSVYAYVGNSPFMYVDREGLYYDTSKCPPSQKYIGCKPSVLDGGGGGASRGGGLYEPEIGAIIGAIVASIADACMDALFGGGDEPPPPNSGDDDDDDKNCRRKKNEICHPECSDIVLNASRSFRQDQGNRFNKCMRQCMYDLGCPNDGWDFPQGWDDGKFGIPRPWLGRN